MLVPPRSIEVTGKTDKRKDAETLVFGRELATEDYALVAGVCVPDLDVKVVIYPEAHEGIPIQITARPEQKGVFSMKLLFQKEHVILESIFSTHKGKAWETFFHLAKKAAELKLKSVSGTALRMKGHDGYRAVIRWGFNADLPDAVTAKLPDALKSKKTLHELAETQEGRDAWMEHGTTIKVSFDLSQNSKSWDILGKPPGAEPDETGK